MTSSGIADDARRLMPNINPNRDEYHIRDVEIQRHLSSPASERPSSSM
jgi:hypothetical protein